MPTNFTRPVISPSGKILANDKSETDKKTKLESRKQDKTGRTNAG